MTFYKFLQLQRFIYFCDLSPSFQKCKDENTIFKTIFTKLLTPIAKQHEQVKMISMFKTTQWPSFSHRNKGNKYIACKLLLLSSYIILCWCYLIVMCVTHKYHQLQSNFLVLSDGCWGIWIFCFCFFALSLIWGGQITRHPRLCLFLFLFVLRKAIRTSLTTLHNVF